jgi:DNA topoisomerase VI subunit A
VGNLRLLDPEFDETLDFELSPMTIFERMTTFPMVESEARFVLIVEKESVFQRLLDENFPTKFPRSILVTVR